MTLRGSLGDFWTPTMTWISSPLSLVFLFVLLGCVAWQRYHKNPKNLPPGPPKSFWFGNPLVSDIPRWVTFSKWKEQYGNNFLLALEICLFISGQVMWCSFKWEKHQ